MNNGSILDNSIDLLGWSLNLDLIKGIGFEDLSDLDSNFRKSFLHGLVKLLLELLLEPLFLLVLTSMLEFLPKSKLSMMTAFLVLFSLLVEGVELLSKLWN